MITYRHLPAAPSSPFLGLAGLLVILLVYLAYILPCQNILRPVTLLKRVFYFYLGFLFIFLFNFTKVSINARIKSSNNNTTYNATSKVKKSVRLENKDLRKMFFLLQNDYAAQELLCFAIFNNNNDVETFYGVGIKQKYFESSLSKTKKPITCSLQT